jgi:hypothetical protein
MDVISRCKIVRTVGRLAYKCKKCGRRQEQKQTILVFLVCGRCTLPSKDAAGSNGVRVRIAYSSLGIKGEFTPGERYRDFACGTAAVEGKTEAQNEVKRKGVWIERNRRQRPNKDLGTRLCDGGLGLGIRIMLI